MDEVDANSTVFERCNLDRANLGTASVAGARFLDCSLSETSLFRCDLSSAEFLNCSLSGCDLTHARLIRTSFQGGQLINCGIYGVSVWDVRADGLQAAELRITPDGQPAVTVDDLDIAQFLYLILENRRLRGVIDAMTGRMVLILGKFTPERKRVLDALRAQLRVLGFVSVLFDFDKPAGRDMTETVSLLAHMSQFVLADITEAKSIPQELLRIVPSLPSVPVQPLIMAGTAAYGMFPDFGGYATVLTPFVYHDDDELLDGLERHVIPAVQARLSQIQEHRAQFEAALRRIGLQEPNVRRED